MSDSTVSDNIATTFTDRSGVSGGWGGGLYLASDFIISNTTIANNLATGETAEGGGLYIGIYDSGIHSMVNAVVTRNSITGFDPNFGGVAARPGVRLTLSAATITGNVGGDCIGTGCTP